MGAVVAALLKIGVNVVLDVAAVVLVEEPKPNDKLGVLVEVAGAPNPKDKLGALVEAGAPSPKDALGAAVVEAGAPSPKDTVGAALVEAGAPSPKDTVGAALVEAGAPSPKETVGAAQVAAGAPSPKVKVGAALDATGVAVELPKPNDKPEAVVAAGAGLANPVANPAPGAAVGAPKFKVGATACFGWLKLAPNPSDGALEAVANGNIVEPDLPSPDAADCPKLNCKVPARPKT